jgi:hypothetical protein
MIFSEKPAQYAIKTTEKHMYEQTENEMHEDVM